MGGGTRWEQIVNWGLRIEFEIDCELAIAYIEPTV
jgi:hypothetical protein